MFKFTFAEQEKTYYLIQAYEKLYLFYDKLEIQANKEYNLRIEADRKVEKATADLNIQLLKKQKRNKQLPDAILALSGLVTYNIGNFLKNNTVMIYGFSGFSIGTGLLIYHTIKKKK